MAKAERIRIYDVARVAGVSVATASKALNDTGRMTEETRKRVKQTAAALGFRPNAMARALTQQRSFTIGLLTNDTYGRFTLPVMAGVSEALVDQGVSVFLCGIEDDAALAKLHLDAMLDKQVDGIIATGKRIDRRLPVDLSHLPVPVVYAFTEGPDDAVTLVSDDAQGARDATEWLHRIGRARLVHVTGPDTFASVTARADAFRAVAGQGGRSCTDPGPRPGGMRPLTGFGLATRRVRMEYSAAMTRSPVAWSMPCVSGVSMCRATYRSSALTIGKS